MAAEDFSFPAIDGNSTCVNGSPPLWCLSSSVASPDIGHENTAEESYDKEDDYEKNDCFAQKKMTYCAHKKSYSCTEDGRRIGKQNDSDADEDEDEDEEEKMDMLWEDFNEELLKNFSSRLGSERLSEDTVPLQLGCLQCSNVPKTSGSLLSTRMASMVVIMKVLKKLLFLHSSRRKLKTRTW